MQAVTVEMSGDPSGMRVRDVPAPIAAPGQAEILVEAIGVGGVDALIRRGFLGERFKQRFIPGSEVAGIVTSTGPGVDHRWIGRRVWAFTGTSGGYAERAVAHVDDIVELPAGTSSTDAVTIGSAGSVAHFALQHAGFKKGDRLLVHGAAGSIGIAAVELAAHRGATAIAVTTSSTERGHRLQELGATHVLDRSGSGDRSAPRFFNVIVDIVGGPRMPAFIERLAPNGHIVMVGAVGGFPPEDFGSKLIDSFQESRSFSTFSLSTVSIGERNLVRAAQFASLARGELTAVIHEVLPLAQAADAHQAMDTRAVFGRIVLVPDSSS